MSRQDGRPNLIKSLRLSHIGHLAEFIPYGHYADDVRGISAVIAEENGRTNIKLIRPKNEMAFWQTVINIAQNDPPIVIASHVLFPNDETAPLDVRIYDAHESFFVNSFSLAAVTRATRLAHQVCISTNLTYGS